MLIVFGGLPGTGKTTIAKALAAKHMATYLRIDEIEPALRSQTPDQEIGSCGSANELKIPMHLRQPCLGVLRHGLCVAVAYMARLGRRTCGCHPLAAIECGTVARNKG